MINELLGKEVTIVPTYIGAVYSVKGKIVEIQAPWVKLTNKKGVVYIHMSQIVQVAPL
jgi:RNase P/RNase MRP subunit p29